MPSQWASRYAHVGAGTLTVTGRSRSRRLPGMPSRTVAARPTCGARVTACTVGWTGRLLRHARRLGRSARVHRHSCPTPPLVEVSYCSRFIRATIAHETVACTGALVNYVAQIREVASANLEELQGDLDQAKHALGRVRGDLEELERRVAVFEYLVELARSDEGPAESAGLTLHGAMAHVLEADPHGMLRARDLAAVIDSQRLYRMRDGRPVEAQQIHARVGQYPHLFIREGTFIKLAE